MAMGFLPVLTLIFVAAKLFGMIDWSWWWVFVPMWGTPAFVLGLGALAGLGWLVVYAGACAWDAWAKWRKARG
jgi:hypothetical protein